MSVDPVTLAREMLAMDKRWQAAHWDDLILARALLEREEQLQRAKGALAVADLALADLEKALRAVLAASGGQGDAGDTATGERETTITLTYDDAEEDAVTLDPVALARAIRELELRVSCAAQSRGEENWPQITQGEARALLAREEQLRRLREVQEIAEEIRDEVVPRTMEVQRARMWDRSPGHWTRYERALSAAVLAALAASGGRGDA